MADWGRIADRGKLTMTIMTRARAARAGYEAHPEALFLGLLYPDDREDAFPMGFRTLECVREFVSEMEPRTIWVQTTAQEEGSAIATRLADLPEAVVQKLH